MKKKHIGGINFVTSSNSLKQTEFHCNHFVNSKCQLYFVSCNSILNLDAVMFSGVSSYMSLRVSWLHCLRSQSVHHWKHSLTQQITWNAFSTRDCQLSQKTISRSLQRNNLHVNPDHSILGFYQRSMQSLDLILLVFCDKTLQLSIRLEFLLISDSISYAQLSKTMKKKCNF